MFFLGTFIEYPGKIAKSCPLHELFVNFRPQISHLAEIASVGGSRPIPGPFTGSAPPRSGACLQEKGSDRWSEPFSCVCKKRGEKGDIVERLGTSVW